MEVLEGTPEKALDTKILGQAIIELNIARKNFSIYPSGHAQLERSIDRAHSVLNRLLETAPELTVGVAKDCLFIGDSYLDRKNLVFKDFALALYSRDIAAVTFQAGLTKIDIHGFCRILTRDTFEIREAGGIRQVVHDASISHIRAQPIDFSGLHLTEEQEILGAKKQAKLEINTHVWRSFVTHLLSGQLDSEGQMEHLANKQKMNPSQIAQLLNSEELDAHLTRMMMALMDKAVDPDDYLVFSRKIMASVPDHLSRGEIDLVYESLRIFRNHAQGKPHPMAQLAKDALPAFSSPEIVSAAVLALDACPEADRDQALSLVAEIGEPCIPDLVKAYADQDYPSSKAALFELLVAFGESTLEEVCRQLHHTSDHFLRNLLLLVQRIGKADSAEALRRLLSHPNLQVRWEALITLLELKDSEAPLYLRRAIQSIDPDESLRAINLAGYYRVRETAEDLVHMIRTNFIGRAAHRANEEIIRALGRIGDARVLPHLERVAAKPWSFSPRRLRHLKLNLFESIGGYPLENLTGLVEIGKRSNDVRIQRICDRLDG